MRFKRPGRKFITIAVTLLVILVIASPLLIKRLPLTGENTTRTDLVLTVCQILSAVFVIIGTFIAVWQYYLSSKSNMIKICTERVQKAIDLSKYYKDEILHSYSILKGVYVKAGIIDILANKKEKMKEFDEQELHDIFTENELKALKSRFTSTEYIKAIIKLNRQYELGLDLCEKYETEEAFSKISIEDKKSIIISFISKYTTPVMNNIEHFAMYFTHNVADESVIYQSIAPTYLEMCRYYYFNIAICSKNSNKIKLYRNLKELYNIWAEKEANATKEMRKHDNNRGTVVENMK